MNRQILAILQLLIVINLTQHVRGEGMIEVFRWKQMDFYNRGDNGLSTQPETTNQDIGLIVFPDQLNKNRGTKYRTQRAAPGKTSRDDPITTNSRWSAPNSPTSNSSSYIPYNNVPMGATHFNGRLFVTMPRRRIGIPSTLNYIDLVKDGNNPSPKLNAYPNFETNYLNPNFEANENRIISVYRTTVDECKRLWFIDTGMLEYPDNRMQIQAPSIWLLDLSTDKVIRRFPIPASIVETGRGLASIAVDVNSEAGGCGLAYAYIPDLVNRLLIVYSLESNRIWAFSHNYFNFDPIAGDLSIGGQTFRWDDGIFSITLGPRATNGSRTVYFHPMASNNEFTVSSEVLQNEANAARSDHGNDFRLLGSRGLERQSTMHEFDPRTGVIFYDEIQRNGVGCWNTNKPFLPEHVGSIASDAKRMIYPSDLTIDQDGTIWIMSNSMPIFIYSNLDTNIDNFRIWKQNVYKAVKNTVCE